LTFIYKCSSFLSGTRRNLCQFYKRTLRVKYMKRCYSFEIFFPLFLVLLALCSCATVKQAAPTLSIDSSLRPGLPVYFRYAFYRHLNQMAFDEVMVTEGKPGKIVAFLDHQFKESVFDSQHEKGVGVFLTGYLKMKTPGKYRFKAMANDGIRVVVNGQRVVYDPAFHSDRFSGIGEVNIASSGWYPLTVKYFQRKGTARLTLYWQPPGTDDFVVVPPEVYGH